MIEFTEKEVNYLNKIPENVSDKQKRDVIKNAGWTTWYNDNYWVHPKVAEWDHTHSGLNLNEAFIVETTDFKFTWTFFVNYNR